MNTQKERIFRSYSKGYVNMLEIGASEMKKYKIIYADPSWEYENKRTGGSLTSGAQSKYPTMSLEEIKRMDIKKIAHKDSVLFLWITVPLLPNGFEVLKSWGYQYKTSLFWRKIMSLGMGFWFRGQVEVLLIGIKGNVKAFRSQRPNFLQTKAKKHSEKPHEIYGLIEEISNKFDLNPKIELFVRNRREGWDSWGNEPSETTQKVISI